MHIPLLSEAVDDWSMYLEQQSTMCCLQSYVGAGIMRQQVLWDALLYHHSDFLIIDSPWCSRHNMKIWAILHSSALIYAKNRLS